MPVPESLRGRLRVPVISSPMFLVSGPDLVVACCANGVVGSLPSLNQRSTEGFAAWLDEIAERLEADRAKGLQPAPYAVNLIVHRTNTRLDADLAVCVERKVPIVITSLGAVADLVSEVHGYGGLVFHDVVNARHAEKAVAAGVDGLILVCAGAGGHAGTLSPFALLPEVRRFFDGTLVLAGSLSDGRAVAAAQMLGADLAYMGTRFIATRESLAPPAFKQMVLEGRAADILYTDAVSGVPGNFLLPSIRAAGLDPEALARPGGGYRTGRGEEQGTKAWKDVWSAGQGIGSIEDLPPVADCIAAIERDYRAAWRAAAARAASLG